jgi:hypothetical protein
MLFRALKIVCAFSLVSLGGCVTGETLGSANCCYPNAITLDGNPVPGNGNVCEHWQETWCAQRAHARHIRGTVSYWAYNTNCDLPPYETFWCDQWPRATYMIGKKFDEHIMNHDWDDPLVNCCEPCCAQPQCTMKYVEPCDRRRCCEPCVPCPTTCEPCPTTYYESCDPCAPSSSYPSSNYRSSRAIDGPR